jgi:hypothetical protein
MGGAVSSLHKIRNRFLLQIHKRGVADSNDSIRALFETIGTEDVHGIQCLSKLNLNEIIGIDSIDILDELFHVSGLQNGDYIPTAFIIDFIEKGHFNKESLETFKNRMISSKGIYPEVFETLGMMAPNDCGTIAIYNDEKGDKKGHKIEHNRHSIWKKHETVIQERIIKQVTIDKDGNKSELITTDKSQNDIIHIESKITGDFAHREFTQQEQTEHLEEELSTFIRATEEYIHLKSKEDEYEYLHSEVPPQEDGEEHNLDEECNEEYESIHENISDYDHEQYHEEEVDVAL